jgi:hypothetical protein
VFKPGNCSLVGHSNCNYIILWIFCNNDVAAASIKEGPYILESIGHRKKKKIGPLSGILADQRDQKSIILRIFTISRVQRH